MRRLMLICPARREHARWPVKLRPYIRYRIWDDAAVDGKLILIDGSSVPVDEPNVKRALAAGTILWLDFKPADPDGIALLRDVFEFHPLAIEAVS